MSEFSRVCVITGASAGLGRCLALEAGRKGFNVALISRREKELREVQGEIIARQGSAVPFPADIQDARSVENVFGEIFSRWNRVDVLFNSAGALEPVAPLIENNNKDLRESLLTNVYGVYIPTREALRQMIKQKEGGTVINITSGAANRPYVGWSAYGSQKAAINSFTEIVALEMAEYPVRIAAISPGPFESRMQQLIRETDEKQFPAKGKFIELYQQKKLGNPEHIAQILVNISLSGWQELSGTIADIRSKKFRGDCREHGIEFPKEFISDRE